MRRGYGLQYITENPFTGAYMNREKYQTDLANNELDQAAKQVAMDEAMAAAPSRLRSINALADTNASQAKVQQATEADRIAQQANQAREGGANADFAVGALPSRLSEVRSQASSAATAADIAEKTKGYQIGQAATAADQAATNLAQDRQLFPSQLATAQSNASNAAAQAEQAQAWKEERFFEIALKDPDAAEIFASRNGFPVPPEMRPLLRNRSLMAVADGLMTALKEKYPGDANTVIRSKEFDRIFQSMAQDQTPTEAEAVGMVTQGKEQPIIPGVAGGNSEFERKRAAWLAIHPQDEQGALDYASGIKHVSDSELWRDAMKQAGEMLKDDTTYLTSAPEARQQQLVGQATRLFNSFKAVPGQPAPAAAPSPAAAVRGEANVPQSAVDFLRQNPNLAPDFDRKYGAGASQRYLTGQ